MQYTSVWVARVGIAACAQPTPYLYCHCTIIKRGPKVLQSTSTDTVTLKKGIHYLLWQPIEKVKNIHTFQFPLKLIDLFRTHTIVVFVFMY